MTVQNNVSIKDLARGLQVENPDMSHEEIENIIKLVFDEISDALICGDKVELRGFCSLHLKARSSTYARNPRTNEPISVENHTTLAFKPSKDLLNSLNVEKEKGSSVSEAA